MPWVRVKYQDEAGRQREQVLEMRSGDAVTRRQLEIRGRERVSNWRGTKDVSITATQMKGDSDWVPTGEGVDHG